MTFEVTGGGKSFRCLLVDLDAQIEMISPSDNIYNVIVEDNDVDMFTEILDAAPNLTYRMVK